MTLKYLYIGIALISVGIAVISISHFLILYITGDLISGCGLLAYYKALRTFFKKIDKTD